MKAYKFKSASQADHVFDLIINKRLFCAPLESLNDPMEGAFVYSCNAKDDSSAVDTLASNVNKALKKLRVCSLSSTFDCHLLWAHYANGFNGVAIEIDLPDDHPQISEVTYRGVFGHFAYSASLTAEAAARQILASKYQEWRYEKELRVISEATWFDEDVTVSRIIVGHRVHPALFDALQMVCEREEVGFNKVGFGDEGIDADWVPSISERSERQSRV